MATRPQRALVVALAITLLVVACSEPNGATPLDPGPGSGVALAAAASSEPVAISLTVDSDLWRGTERRRESGWWNPLTRIGGMRDEAGDVVWLEDNGVVLRPEINPNADTDWTAYDVHAWGAATPDDLNYWGVGTAMQSWAAPTIQSIARLRDVVTAEAAVDGLDDGDHTVTITGTAFLETLDELIARRALTPCDVDVPIDITLTSGAVTRVAFTTSTGVLDREVVAEFGVLGDDGPEIPGWPDAAAIATTRPPSTIDERPRPEASCDWPERAPVRIERVGCEEPAFDNDRYDLRSSIEVLERRSQTIPGAPGGAWISPWEPIDPADLQRQASARDLVVRALAVQVPTSNRGVFNIVGIQPVADQDALDQTADDEIGDIADISGPAAVVGFIVEGTWADIASWADTCAIYTTGMPDTNTGPATPHDVPAE